MKKQFTKMLLTMIVLGAMVTTNVLAQFITVLPNDNSTSGNGRSPSVDWTRNRAVYLIKASEMAAAGYTNGTQVGRIGWTYTAASAAGTGPLIIYLENTSDVTNTKSTTWSTAITGMTTVHNATTLISSTATPNISFSGGSAFTYTGGGVYVAYDWGCYTGGLFAVTTVCNSTGLVSGLKSAQSTVACPNTAFLTALTAASSFRPETRFAPPPPPNDASVDQIYTLGSMPVVYTANHIIQALITNGGTNTLTGLNVTLSITGSNTFSDVQTIASLAPFTSTTVIFAGFTPGATGTNTVTVSVPADSLNSNNSQTMTQGINTNLASYKYIAPITGGVGFNVTGAGQFQGVFVSKFTTADAFSNADTVNEVKINFQASTALSRYFRVVIFPDSSGFPGIPSKVASYVTAQQTINNTAQQAFLPINPPIALSGTFYVGVTQDSANTVNFGYSYQSESPVRSSNFFYGAFANGTMTTATWTDFNPGAPFRSAIEVQYYIPVPPNCAINQSPVNGGTACKNGATLSWASGGGGPTGYDVYFSTVQSDVNNELVAALVSANQVATTYSTGTMVGGTTYYWKAVPKNADGTATGCSTFSFTANLGSCYCGSTATDGTFEYVSNVASGIYTNSSTSGLYQDHTATGVVNNVQLNSFFDVFVTITNPYDDDYIYVFADFNQDGDFNDAGELAGEADPSGGTGTGTSVEQVTLSVPAGALPGNTVMRIKMGDEVNPTALNNNPCQTFTYGEVEDYVINVLPCGAGASSNDPVCTNSTINLSSVHYGTGAVNSYSWTGPNSFTSSSPSPSIPNATSLNAGTYTVTMTDANNCTSSSSTVVNISDIPIPDATSNAPVCEGFPLNLFGDNTASGQSTGNTWSWSGPSYSSTLQNPSVSGSAALSNSGTYTLTVTNLNGCTASLSTSVTINPNPVIIIGSQTNVSCNGLSDGEVDLDATFGAPNYIYSLDGSPTVDGIYSGLGAGVYLAEVIDNNGCEATDTNVTITVLSTAPPATSAGQPVSPNNYACSGSVYSITTQAIGGTDIRYSWNTGTNSSVVLYSTVAGGPFSPGPFQTTANQVYAQFGTLAGSSGYNICVQGVNGCGSTNNRCLSIRGVVSVPGTITPPNNAVACPADVKSYSCGVSGGATQYNWTLGGSAVPVTTGQGTTNVSVAFPAGFTTGQLCVTAQLPCGGSSLSAPRCMTISNTPAVPGSFTAGPSTVCPGSIGVTYTIPAVAGATGYNWTTPVGTTITSGQNTPSIQVSFPDPYTGAPPVCVSALSSCGSSVARCKTVGSSIPIQPGAISGPTTNVCNSTAQYSVANVAGASSYFWTAPAGTTISSGQNSSTILLSVSNSFISGALTVTANTALCSPGTSIPRTITIYGRPTTPTNITTNPSSWCNGGFVTFSAVPGSYTPAVTYNWSVTQGTITAGQGTNNADVTWGTGTGNVVVSASNLCGSNSPHSQSFTGQTCREEGTVSTTAFAVYPNPAHDKITVSIDVKEQTQFNVKLRDISGRVILSEDHAGVEGLNAYEMDLRSFAKGIYMLEVHSGSDSWKTKVVIE